MYIWIYRLSMVVTPRVDNEAIIRVDVSARIRRVPSPSLRHMSLPCLIYRMIPTPKTPRRIRPPTSSWSVEIMSMKLILLMWTWWKREVHEMGDGSLPLPSVWILHAEQLSFCILIQRSKLLALLVLWLAYLLVAWCGAGSRVAAAAAAAPSLTAVVGEELLGGGAGWAALTRNRGSFG